MNDKTVTATERWSRAMNTVDRWTRERTEAIEARRLAELIKVDGVAEVLADFENRLRKARRKWDRAREDATRGREDKIDAALTRRGEAIRKAESRRMVKEDAAYASRLEKEER
ncbi:MAG: hypothetical protein OEV00_03700, partial [Acidobacteriota bacterium]|nr:hypothetical protein [Acidobacteriota bacterium]